MKEIDLDDLSKRHNIKIVITPVESTSDRKIRHFKEVLLYLVGVPVAALLALYCIECLHNPAATTTEKYWAISILAAIGSAVMMLLTVKRQ